MNLEIATQTVVHTSAWPFFSQESWVFYIVHIGDRKLARFDTRREAREFVNQVNANQERVKVAG